LVYDVKLGSWWIKENYPVRISSMAIAKRGSSVTWDNLQYSSWDTFKVDGGWDAIGTSEDEPVILIGGGDGYARYLVAGENDDGTDVISHYSYPFDNLNGDDEQMKVLQKIFVETSDGYAGSIRLRVFTNANDTDPRSLDDQGNTFKTITLAPTEANRIFQVTEVDVDVKGFSFSVLLESDSYHWAGRILKMEYDIIGKGIH
jgi:hypothetical protein